MQTTASVNTPPQTASAVLVGQPNVGKSVIFHALTGKYAHVSNFAGTTVEVSFAETTIQGRNFKIIDSPGVISLPPRTEDEAVTRDIILQTHPEVIVQVADAKDLPHALQLTLELSEYGIPQILVLNMIDEARDRGIIIDSEVLAHRLGIPVIETVAVTGEGIGRIKKEITNAAVPKIKPQYDGEFEALIKETESSPVLSGKPFSRALALSVLLNDKSVLNFMEKHSSSEDACSLCAKAQGQCTTLKKAPELLGFKGKEQALLPIISETIKSSSHEKKSFWHKLGVWCVSPFPGYLIAAGVLYLLYQFVGVFGAQTLVGLLEEQLFGNYFNPWISGVFDKFIPFEIVRSAFVGEYGMITMALTYALALIFPIVTTFFIFFGILEDSGYLPRLAVMLDRFFRLFGLNGRAVLPMVLGLGCGTMATVTTRILGSTKEKILVSLLLTLAVPCSAQLGVIFGMAAGVSFKVLLIWIFIVTLSVMGIGWLGSKVIPGVQPPFLIQLPPLRLPQPANIFKKVVSRLHWYAIEVIPLFLIATFALFILHSLGWLKIIENMMSPVIVHWLGLPAETASAFLIGFLRRDYGAAGLYEMERAGLLSPVQILISMILVTLFMPCIAHLLVTVKERGLKVTTAIFAFVMGYALLVSGFIRVTLEYIPII